MDRYIETVINILKEVNQYEEICADTDLMEAGIPRV